jgi:DNA-binding MarR family transcriptional regulator
MNLEPRTLAYALDPNPQKAGVGWTVNCPAHHDEHKSLSINPGKTQSVVYRCHAGCPQDAVRAAGIAQGKWPENGRAASAPPPVRTVKPVASHAPDGVTLAKHYGLDWSDFTQAGCVVEQIYFKQAKGKLPAVVYPLAGLDGEQRRKARSVERFADRLPVAWPDGKRLAIHPGGGKGFFPADALEGPDPLVVCAGEEKALALRRAGFRAVSYSAGEGSLPEEATQFLIERGNKNFIVCLDAGKETDCGGPKWADALKSCGADTVRVVSWPAGTPDKYDVNDLLREKGVEQLRAVLKGAGITQPSGAQTPHARKPSLVFVDAVDLAKTEFPPLVWAVEGFLPAGLSVLAAPPKAGKSLLLTLLACCVATGKPFLGYRTCKGPVLYIDIEASAAGVQRRLKAIGWPDGAAGLQIATPPTGFQLDGAGMIELQPMLEELRPKLLILDTAERLVPHSCNAGKLDAHQATVARLGSLQEWIRDNNVAAVGAHHTGKSSKGTESFDAISGSRGWTATAEHLMTMMRHEGTQYRLSVESRHMGALDLLLERKGTDWSILGDFDEAAMTDEQRVLLEYVAAHPKCQAKAVSDALGMQPNSATQALRRAAKRGLLIKQGRGAYSVNPLSVVSQGQNEDDKMTDMTGGSLSAREAYALTPDSADAIADTVQALALAGAPQ